MKRRAFLAGAAAALAARSALADGPKVFRDYDQAALDAAYDQSKYAPNLQQVVRRYTTNSELARARLGAPRRVAYGTAPIEQLDIYRTERPNAPVHVFIHGGAWRAGLAKDYAFPAEMFVQAGAHYVVPDFAWVQDTDSSLLPIAEQIRRAIAWVARNAASFGGDAGRIYVSGHSSGAHQAGVLAATDWKQAGLPADAVKGYVLISGMYDLLPVSLSSRSSYIWFDERTLEELSAMRHLDRIGAPVTVVHGTLETPEFQRQSREFAEALRKAGKPVQLIAADGYNHFEVMETLANPFQFAGRAALEQMKLKAPL
ncbi:MAG TPA: alpha/beta hydrolase [Burkholderiales bacterium]|nr:alpha/beta hydrolase [Burkholderiales bacterium]